MLKLWEKMQTLGAFQKKNKLPESPGVYFFLDARKKLLYIGKATSLRDRVKSYFLSATLEMRGPKIERMLEKVAFVAHRKTDSVLEALILEASLIKVHQPVYNTDAKDDKSYNFVVITQEKYPRVLIVRGRDILRKNQNFGSSASKIENRGYKYVFGPFPAGGALCEALKIVRKLFPYRDKCKPFEDLSEMQKKKTRPCFSAQIGLCPGMCTGEISFREYGRTINNVRLFFEGHKNTVVQRLQQEMKVAVKNLEFEHANEIKKTLFGLRHIQDVALIKEEVRSREQGTREMRIEAYDVAHLGGSASVGVMVVMYDGKTAKEFYRKFILRGGHKGNDLSALQEILERRLKHTEWTLPEIIVIDGGEPQLNIAQESFRYLAVKPLSKLRKGISVVGVVKNAKHQPQRLIGEGALIKRFRKEILLANSEAHRFAITFHRKRRGKEFLST